jgi:hypothetical protein
MSEKEMTGLPEHLCDTAPCQRCSRCGRATYTKTAFGSVCGLTQPNGLKCDGTFVSSRAGR